MRLKSLTYIIILCLNSGLVSANTKHETDSLKQLFTKLSADSNKVKLAFRISKLYWNSNPDSAQFYAQKGLQLARSIHFRKGEADCLNSLSAVFWMQRNYPMALDYTLQNLTIRHELVDSTGIFNASNNLALIYYETRKYDLALRYGKEAISIATDLKDQKKIAKASANLGIIYFQLNDTSKAYSSYKRAFDIQTMLNDSYELSYIYYNMGELFLTNNPAKAIPYLRKSLFIAEKQDNKELIAACLQILADEKRKEGRIDESIALAKKALSVASEIKHLKVIDLAAQTLYKAYLQKRNFEESLAYYIVANNAQDSMLSEKKIAEMSDLKYSFDLKQKMKQIELLERDKIIAEKSAQSQRLLFYLEILAVVLVSVVLFGVYRSYRIRKQNEERAIYEQKLLSAKEKAEENDRLKTAFLCNMSHEIRTPMNAIIGFTDLMVYKEVSAENRTRYLKLIKERTVDLLRIIEDILDISKIEVGQVSLYESETDINELMLELLEYYNLKINGSSKPNLKVSYKLDGALRKSKIFVDTQRLKQILVNLLNNAHKFTEEGFIEYGCRVNGDSKLLFYVKDTGIGIPEDKLEVIFDRFRQANEQYHIKQFGGTGLGLSIVKGLLALMNGEVWVESTSDKGSTFYFTLPASVICKNQLINP